jgi:two-component system, LytTR family, response regulator
VGLTKTKTGSPEIERLSQRVEQIYQLLKQKTQTAGLEYLVVRSGEKFTLVPTSAILWIEANGHYARIHRGKEATLVRKSMKALEAELDSKRFIRVHRSAIVNVDCIREFQPMFHGEFRLVLRNGTNLTLSRHYRRNFQKLVGETL